MEGTDRTVSLSGNALKIFAAISMVTDHVGMLIFPQNEVLRIIGRLAFPIFSFMICEGCKYTKNRLAYLLRILILGIVTTAVSAFAMGEIYFNSLVTFSCSILLILLILQAKESENKTSRIACLLLLLGASSGYWLFTKRFTVDYGFWGIMLPIFPCVSELISPQKKENLLVISPRFWAFAAGLLILSLDIGWIQPYSLLALIPLAFYNGTRGFRLPKYSFYVFYPLHIAVIYLISIVI